MTLSKRIAALLLCLLCAIALTACGAEQTDTATDASSPAAPAEEQGDESTTPSSADGAEFKPSPQTYQMLTINGQDTAQAVEEYLNSGYSEAAFQLVLFDDGGGLLYVGRTLQGVRYKYGKLFVNGTRAKVSYTDEGLALTVDGDTMIFEPTGTPSAGRTASSAFIGRYNQLDNTGTVLDRLRLRKGGTGAHLRAGATKKTKVFWGTDPVFGMNYIMIRGVLYEFGAQQADGFDPPRYDITVYDEHRTHFTPVKK